MSNSCSVENCPSTGTARSGKLYCQMHYRRLRLYGDVHFVLRTQRRGSFTQPVILEDNLGKVPLQNGQFALINAFDAPRIGQYNWNVSNSTGYAYSHRVKTSMHQYLLGKAPYGMHIDHINRDKLDNRRANLRFVTRGENLKNSAKSDNAVHYAYHKMSRAYQSYIILEGQQIYLGLNYKEEDAQARSVSAKILAKDYPTIESFKTAWKLLRHNNDSNKADE